MSDKELALDILSQIINAFERVMIRFEPVHSSDLFISSEVGLEKLDSIYMQLIAIGENLKKLDKVEGRAFLESYLGAKGMRDIVSHHYFGCVYRKGLTKYQGDQCNYNSKRKCA
jgi:uncharacterized protein with HEPN domain